MAFRFSSHTASASSSQPALLMTKPCLYACRHARKQQPRRFDAHAGSSPILAIADDMKHMKPDMVKEGTEKYAPGCMYRATSARGLDDGFFDRCRARSLITYARATLRVMRALFLRRPISSAVLDGR